MSNRQSLNYDANYCRTLLKIIDFCKRYIKDDLMVSKSNMLQLQTDAENRMNLFTQPIIETEIYTLPGIRPPE